MSSYADIGRQGKNFHFFPLSVTAPADSIRRATSYWGCPPNPPSALPNIVALLFIIIYYYFISSLGTRDIFPDDVNVLNRRH